MKKKKSKSIHFRANAQDQKRLAALKKKYETDNAGAIREALRIATDQEKTGET